MSSRDSRPSSAAESGASFGSAGPAAPPEAERSSRVSRAEVLMLQPKKESREPSWFTGELKKAGGSWGVGAGRTGGAACETLDVLWGTENSSGL